MKTQQEINEEIEKTMRALDGIEIASPKPFFYTRLKARLENEKTIVPAPIKFVMKPAFVFGTLAIVLLLNVVTVISYSKKKKQHSESSQTITDGETLESFSKEYSIDDFGN